MLKKLFAILIITSAGLIGLTEPSYAKTAATPTAPTNKTDCEAAGGKWGGVGIFPAKVCNLPTKDAGKICSDGSECEGDCIAELSKSQLDQVMYSHATFYTKGKCTARRIVVSCHPVVRRGMVKGLLCRD